jgi:multisubunit Na+/H+ antiporter MnhE subunit
MGLIRLGKRSPEMAFLCLLILNIFWLILKRVFLTDQGDRIGLIFAYWTIFYFRQFLKTAKLHNFGFFFPRKKLCTHLF